MKRYPAYRGIHRTAYIVDHQVRMPSTQAIRNRSDHLSPRNSSNTGSSHGTNRNASLETAASSQGASRTKTINRTNETHRHHPPAYPHRIDICMVPSRRLTPMHRSIAVVGGTGDEGVAARAGDLHCVVIRMDTLLHSLSPRDSGDPGRIAPMARREPDNLMECRRWPGHGMRRHTQGVRTAIRGYAKDPPLPAGPHVPSLGLEPRTNTL